MSEEKDSLDNIVLTKINNPSTSNDLISFSLSLKINGRIRKLFNQSLWEKAYNKFDNTFRITINVDLKSGNKILYSIKFVKKAVFFWTRNPRIPHRIWIFIVKDDSPFYPESEEEAKSLLFDIEKIIELKPSIISKKRSKIYANVKISWGRHIFTEPTTLEGKSNEEEIQLIFS
ncbi:MAG TPA: hypothetical protein VFZ46_05985 [Nitrososphaeraceae archaeon]